MKPILLKPYDVQLVEGQDTVETTPLCSINCRTQHVPHLRSNRFQLIIVDGAHLGYRVNRTDLGSVFH